MRYYIYRNWVAEKKAVIHRGECRMCNNGKGCHKNPLGNKNGEWSKGFKAFTDAKKEASRPYRGKHLKIKFCGKCKPDINRMKNELSKYEKSAVFSIHEWKSPQVGWSGKGMEIINWPLEKASDLVAKVPGVNWVIETAIGGLVDLLNDLAHLTVRPEAIYEEYRRSGFEHVKTPHDIFSLDLEEADRVTGWLGAKYKTLTTAEGAVAGYVGLLGIPPDIIALITLNQRAIAEYATYYGFDISSQQERLFALNIMGLASSPNDVAKQVAMAQLVRIAQDVAKKKVWKDLEKHSFVKIIQIISRSLGIRLTKAKLAQIVPVTGSVVGAGFNAYYTNKACDAAFYLYRERFLAEKYGSDIIEETVNPADDFEPDLDD